MRKIILSVAISLDGFIEGDKGEYDWCPPPSTGEMSAFLNRIDTIFMGRKSFGLFNSKMFPGKKVVVFSHTLTDRKGVMIISHDLVSKVKLMKNEPGKDIWLYGGASLTTTFFNEGLVDEMWLGIVPVILGSGKSLFQNISVRNYFSIVNASDSNGYVSIQLQKKEVKKKGKVSTLK